MIWAALGCLEFPPSSPARESYTAPWQASARPQNR